jgi:hypothetical protein
MQIKYAESGSMKKGRSVVTITPACAGEGN